MSDIHSRVPTSIKFLLWLALCKHKTRNSSCSEEATAEIEQMRKKNEKGRR